MICLSGCSISSVKHEYEGKWNDAKTRLTTCDPHSKHTVVNSNSPQEVAEKQEIVFTYDVEFQVSYSIKPVVLLHILLTQKPVQFAYVV